MGDGHHHVRDGHCLLYPALLRGRTARSQIIKRANDVIDILKLNIQYVIQNHPKFNVLFKVFLANPNNELKAPDTDCWVDEVGCVGWATCFTG